MKGDNELAALIAATDADMQCEMELGEVLGRFRARRDRAIRDQEAARLLPLGAGIVAERQGCHRVTVYRRAQRGKIVASKLPAATTG